MAELTHKEMSSRGGKATSAGMTFEQLSERGKKLVEARKKKYPGNAWAEHYRATLAKKNAARLSTPPLAQS